VIKNDLNIVCILQLYNEIRTGHLVDFFKYNADLFDHVIVYDDGSTDGTLEYCQNITPHIIRSSNNNYKNEMRHKKELLEIATKLDAEYVVSLDADEILLLTRTELEEKCLLLGASSFNGIRVNFINLWRSFNYKRVDNLFDEYRPIKIWKHDKSLDPYSDIVDELHQPLHPQYITNIMEDMSISIFHTGFSTEERILRKFLIYKKHGQKGFDLLRLINERKLKLEEIPIELIPKGFSFSKEPPAPKSLKYFVEKSIKLKDKVFKPKISIVCLIYKDVKWLEFVYQQIQKYTDLSDNEFFFVANGATQEVKDYLYNNYIPHYLYDHTEDQKNEYYINNVYRAYNFGVEKSRGDFSVLINSDMAFSENWLENLFKNYSGKNCVASRLVEQGRLTPGKYGIAKNFGCNFDDYKEEEFNAYALELKEDRLVDSGLYMPLLIKVETFKKIEGYPEGNIKPGSDIFNPTIALPGEAVISGDAVLMEKLNAIGISHQTAFESIVYHFQEGEKSSDSKIISEQNEIVEIAVCNDILTGTMGEKVLWDYLLKLPKTIGLSYEVVGGKKSITFQEYIANNYSDIKIVLQNASFMDTVDPSIFTIVFLQDDLRRMRNPSLQQEQNLNNADICITNSYSTASSYPEFDFEIIPVGVDSELFSPRDKKALRNKWNIPLAGKIGIFVGALNEVKGWSRVLDVIENDISCHWIVVTKYGESFDHPRVTLFSKQNQADLSELLCCSDFFILGSEVETQCLAAIEAALCDVPIIMDKTGIFADINEKDLSRIGVFNEDFKVAVVQISEREFSPRETILKYPITINDSMGLWRSLLCKAKLQSINNIYRQPMSAVYGEKSLFSMIKLKLEFFYRKRLLASLIGRDQFYSISEISHYLKQHIPKGIFSMLRFLWRFFRELKN